MPDLATALRLRQIFDPTQIASDTQPNIQSDTNTNDGLQSRPIPQINTQAPQATTPDNEGSYAHLKRVLTQQPQQSDYEPSGWRRLGAGLAGFGAGMRDPKAGVEIANQIKDEPFNNAYQDWQRNTQPVQHQYDIDTAKQKENSEEELRKARGEAALANSESRKMQAEKQSSSVQTMKYILDNYSKIQGTNPDLLDTLTKHLTPEHQMQLAELKSTGQLKVQDSRNAGALATTNARGQNAINLEQTKEPFIKTEHQLDRSNKLELGNIAADSRLQAIPLRGDQQVRVKQSASYANTHQNPNTKTTADERQRALTYAQGQLYNKYKDTPLVDDFDMITGLDKDNHKIIQPQLKSTAHPKLHQEMQQIINQNGQSQQSPLEDRIGKLLDSRGL